MWSGVPRREKYAPEKRGNTLDFAEIRSDLRVALSEEMMTGQELCERFQGKHSASAVLQAIRYLKQDKEIVKLPGLKLKLVSL